MKPLLKPFSRLAGIAILVFATALGNSANATPVYQRIDLPVSVSTSSSGLSRTVTFSINDTGVVSSSQTYTGVAGTNPISYSLLSAVGSQGYAFWIIYKHMDNLSNASLATSETKVITAIYKRNTRTWDIVEARIYLGGGANSMNPWSYEFSNISLSLAQANWTVHKSGYEFLHPTSIYTNETSSIPTQNPAPVFTTQPTSQTVSTGSNVSFQAAASGATSFQWRKNGGNLTGQTASTLALTNVQSYDAGNYSVVVSNQGGSSDESSTATLTVSVPNQAPVATVSIDGLGSGALIYRPYGGAYNVNVHFHATDGNGNLSGIRPRFWNSTTGTQNNDSYLTQSGASGDVVRTVSLNENGDWYFWTDAIDANGAETNSGAWQSGYKITVLEAPAPLTPNANSVLANLSTRAVVGSGGNVLIAGFVISGAGSKNILATGVGPWLAQFGINAITDPSITLNTSGGQIGSNNDWQTNSNASQITTTGAAVGAQPLSTKESALLPLLSSNAYSVVLSNLGTGSVGMINLYDASVGTGPKLVNLSSRAYVGSGNDVLIVGFVISGGNKRVLITGKGPWLTSQGITNALANPQISLANSSGTQVIYNDNWQNAWNTAAISSTGFAANSNEAAIYEVLAPGAYTVILSGVSSGTGVGLLEINDL